MSDTRETLIARLEELTEEPCGWNTEGARAYVAMVQAVARDCLDALSSATPADPTKAHAVEVGFDELPESLKEHIRQRDAERATPAGEGQDEARRLAREFIASIGSAFSDLNGDEFYREIENELAFLILRGVAPSTTEKTTPVELPRSRN